MGGITRRRSRRGARAPLASSLATVVVACSVALLSSSPIKAQETDALSAISPFFAPENDTAEQPGPHWDRFHDVETARAAVEACLGAQSERDGDLRDCLGHTADPCLSHMINQSTAGSIQCARGEADAWAQIIDESLEAAMGAMDPGARAMLLESQETWLAYRAAACAVPGEVFRGGSIGRQIGSDCWRDKTGRRAIELMETLPLVGL